MIILPDRHIPRARFLMPMAEREWTKQLFRVRAKTHDGVVLWTGWFECREDFDAFLWAVVLGNLPQERPLWDLPTPMWPGLDPGLLYDFNAYDFITGPTDGSNHTYTSKADWTNTGNHIHVIGGGGSGAIADNYQLYTVASGGGGAGYSVKNDFTFANPGVTTATYRCAAGGSGNETNPSLSTYAGHTGGDSWFNGTTLGGSTVGAKGGGAGAFSFGGTSTGGAGGASGSGIGDTKYSGGKGGDAGNGASYSCSSGGGGVGGPNGNGGAAPNNAVDKTAKDGGRANNGVGAYGGSGDTKTGSSAEGHVGYDGTEWGSYGPGGGGGAGYSYNVTTGNHVYGGDGGNYGGGGGGSVVIGGDAAQLGKAGKGGNGLIALEYIPATGGALNMAMLGM